jgi:hypothetical protein
MSIKNIIVVCFIVAIAVCSGYFLYQIDLHEKALLGQAWINPVPNDIWQKYLVDKQTHEENVKKQVDANQDVIKLIRIYKTIDNGGKQKPDWIVDNDLIVIQRGPKTILSEQVRAAFAASHPEEYNRWIKTGLDLIWTAPSAPHPHNPPKPVIQQRIQSIYRYLAAVDGVLILSLILFLILYKEIPRDISQKV